MQKNKCPLLDPYGHGGGGKEAQMQGKKKKKKRDHKDKDAKGRIDGRRITRTTNPLGINLNGFCYQLRAGRRKEGCPKMTEVFFVLEALGNL